METVTSTEVKHTAAHRLIDTLANGFADITVGLIGSIAAEYNRQQAAKKQAQKEACVDLIMKAMVAGKRVSKSALYDIIPSLSYCNNRKEMAEYIGISIDQFNAGVKRWYHIF